MLSAFSDTWVISDPESIITFIGISTYDPMKALTWVAFDPRKEHPGGLDIYLGKVITSPVVPSDSVLE